MKQLPLFCLIVALLQFACKESSPQEIPTTIIKGKITVNELNPYMDNEHLGIVYNSIISGNQNSGRVYSSVVSGIEVPNQQVKIDARNNEYRFEIKIEEPTEIRLKYRFNTLSLFLHPGEEITIDIDAASEEEWPLNPFRFQEGSTPLSQQVAAFDQLLRDSFDVELRATLPYVVPNEFKTQRRKITERIRSVQKSFIQENEIQDSVLINWTKHHSEYRIAMDYLKYAFKVYGFNRFSPNLKEGFPEAYFDFWEEFPINNPIAITSLNYQNYLQLYRKYLMAKLKDRTTYQDCRDFPGCNVFDMEIRELSQYLEGSTKDLALSQQVDYHLIRNNQSFLKAGFDNYLAAISDTLLTAELRERKKYFHQNRTIPVAKDANLLEMDGTGQQVLKNIAQQHQRPTILYFWNTQRDISYYYAGNEETKKTWKKLDSLGFDLVLLAHHSNQNIWKEKVADLELIGDQWHLSDQQFYFFEDYFNENRKYHPHYDKILDRENFMLLVDANGKLTTLGSIRFLERSFTYLNSLPAELMSAMAYAERNQIKVSEE